MASARRKRARILILALVLAGAALLILRATEDWDHAPLRPRAAVAPDAADTAADTVASTQVPEQSEAVRSTMQFRTAVQRVAIDGRVVDRFARPLAGVTVSFDGAGDADPEVHTDAGGAFRVDVAPGGYQLIARGAQLLTHCEFVQVEATQPRAELTLCVDVGVPLVGQVVDGQGRSVAGAVVTPWRRGAVGDELDARCAVTSGADGRFRLHGVADAVTWVLVEAAGYTAGKHALQPGRDAVLALRGR